MGNRFSNLKCKEVVNVCDGCRLGYVCDVEVDCRCGQICAIIVPGKGRCFGLLGHGEDFVIPWKCIRQIGDDIILIEGDTDLWKNTLKFSKKTLAIFGSIDYNISAQKNCDIITHHTLPDFPPQCRLAVGG